MTLLHDFLTRTAQKGPGHAAVIADGRAHSFRTIYESSGKLAAALQSGGLEKGDRVAVCLENSAELVISLFATMQAGGVFVPISPLTPARKLAFLLGDAGARGLIVNPQLGQAISSCDSPAVETIIVAGKSPAVAPETLSLEAILDGPCGRLADPGLIDQDLCAIIYTSGSSGEAKGVMLTHQNLVNSTTVISTYLGNTADDVVCCVLPLSFSYGLCQVLAGARAGYTLLLERSFAYPFDVLRRMADHRATGLPCVPTMAARLIQMLPHDGLELSSLRYITNAAAPMPVAHVNRLCELFPKAAFYSMYGQTECTRATFLDPDRIGRKPASVGKAMANCEAYIVDEDGQRVGPNVVGELVVRGTNVMRGYWNRPDETRNRLREGAIPGEKILHTGDEFRMDDEGDLYFVGRKDDVFKCRGEKVSPLEIERVICELPGVLEAAVVGVDDETDGKAVKAVIVLCNGSTLSRDRIRRHCRANLEPFLVPKSIEIIPDLPKTDSGKVNKRELCRSVVR